MPNPWFRLYRSMVDNPKAQALRPDLFKAWINLLCCTDDDGHFPDMSILSFKLRKSEAIVSKWFSELSALGFIVDNKAHDWDEHQFKSDVSTERVKRFRQRSKQRSSNAERNAPDTDTDTDKALTEPLRAKTRAKAQRWPSDAIVPEDWIEAGHAARARHSLPKINLAAEAEAFANYWASKSGASAAKLDWRKTWINWTLNAKGKSHGTAKPSQLEQLAGIIADDGGFED